MSPSDAEEPIEDQQATLSAEDEKHLEGFARKYFIHPPGEPWTPSAADIGRILRSEVNAYGYFAEHYPDTPKDLLAPIIHRALLKDGIDVFACLKEENNTKALAALVRRTCRRFPQAQRAALTAHSLRGLLEAVREYPQAYREGVIVRLWRTQRAHYHEILAKKREGALDHNGRRTPTGSRKRPKQFSQLPADERRQLAGIPARTEAPTIQGYLFHHPCLTAEESAVLITRYPYGENRTWPEVAEKLAMPEITAKRRHACALAKLRKALPPGFHI